MLDKKTASYLSLSRKAGKADGGEFSVENAVKSGRAALVLIAEDASENTKKKFQNMCSFYRVPCRVYGEKEELGHCIGMQQRAVIVLRDEGLAAAVEKTIPRADEEL